MARNIHLLFLFLKKMAHRLQHRPWLMRLPFLSLREKLYYKFYAQRAGEFKDLYQSAHLAFLPNVQLQLVPTDSSHQWIALTGFYELILTRTIVKLAKEGGVLVDAGANFGYYSCLWAGLNPNNRVIAFEPSPLCLPHLKGNVMQNNLGGKVEIREIALGKENGTALFDLGPNEQTGWGGFALSAGERQAEVRVARLDDILEDIVSHKPVDVLKIDVEGADTWVLLGAKNVLRDKKIKHIFFEENSTRMRPLHIAHNEAVRFLQSFGYTVKYLTQSIVYAHS
ncbi:MAG: hypothetical protein A2Y00_07350 [Omnitrophica WOR_2 bacterium GWF2_43_52]|nr:MAG: hypothetical protein A2Y00_07350 [Omnitrophica WOR_2 bacterium GWF2_43_52]